MTSIFFSGEAGGGVGVDGGMGKAFVAAVGAALAPIKALLPARARSCAKVRSPAGGAGADTLRAACDGVPVNELGCCTM